MKSTAEPGALARNGCDEGRHSLYIYRTKHERLLTICSFLLRADCQTHRSVVVADGRLVELADSLLRYAGGRELRQPFHPVVAEQLAHPGSILSVEAFLKSVRDELDSAAGSLGAPARRMVIDMQYIATQIGSPADLTRVASGLRAMVHEQSLDLLSLFFVETLPKSVLQPFLDQFDQVSLCETLQRFLCAQDEVLQSPYACSLLRLALRQEQVLRHVLTIDAVEPRGTTYAPRTAEYALPELTDYIDDPLVLLDPQLRIVFCTRPAAELLAAPRRHLTGTLLSDYLSGTGLKALLCNMADRDGRSDFAIALASDREVLVGVRRIELFESSIGFLLQLRSTSRSQRDAV